MKPLLITLALLCAGCASTAETTQPAQATGTEGTAVAASAASDSDKNQVICRYETPTGSHRRVRVCRTFAEQELENRNSTEAIRRRQEQIGHGGGSGG